MIRSIAEDPLNRSRFPIDPWRFVEVEPDAASVGVTETLFTVGNGYLGMRGNPEEGRTSYAHGTFINGFHETWEIKHAEEAFGFARTGQTIVNAPDAKLIKVYVDDEPFTLSVADLDQYERALDLASGRLTRTVVWRTPAGKRVQIKSSRMVSFTDRHLALMELEVTLLEGGDAPVVISSQIVNRQDGYSDYRNGAEGGEGFDPRRTNKFKERVLEPELNWVNGRRMVLGFQTARSGMTLAVAADHSIETENEFEAIASTEHDVGKQVYRIEAVQGVPITLRKAVAYHTSRGVPVSELSDRCRRTLDRVYDKGFDYYYDKQRAWLDEFWLNSDVVIEGKPSIQQAVRWCLFQVAQAAARSDQHGIAAKGVSGSGYEGHYFWDTEIYLLPFLIYTSPGVARNALRFRVNLLPQARERASVLSQRGALFPWRTINGEEASAYYAAGTAQYHIDADVAHAFEKYRDLTGDQQFMYRDGASVLVETARMWADLGFWRVEAGGKRFHIHGVTGPDEYSAVVNNNMFTNVMARANLRYAASLMREMREVDEAAYRRVVESLDLKEDEIKQWESCADGMVVLFDETFGIHPQDEKFLQSELWDLGNTPDDRRPLLLNYHPLVIYRFQVLKQADVVLALFLHGNQFSAQEKRANFEYYDPITTGDSTLSNVVQSVMAAEVGYQDMAMQYFLSGLFVDLADLHSNARDGVHIASSGGVWNALVYGFAGLRDYGGHVSFDPRLPAEWPSITFPLRIRGSRLRVRVERESIDFDVEEGSPVELSVRGEHFTVFPGAPVTVELDGHGDTLPSMEGTHPVAGIPREDGSVVQAVVPESHAHDISDDGS